ncbi:hypothetical protein IPM62_01935 [Candidatus Woesebacteria bacterium]|nr:MAG: hypothetical protein IPM62_01935 [Candidatus Woesebacteria bacterium]
MIERPVQDLPNYNQTPPFEPIVVEVGVTGGDLVRYERLCEPTPDMRGPISYLSNAQPHATVSMEMHDFSSLSVKAPTAGFVNMDSHASPVLQDQEPMTMWEFAQVVGKLGVNGLVRLVQKGMGSYEKHKDIWLTVGAISAGSVAFKWFLRKMHGMAWE